MILIHHKAAKEQVAHSYFDILQFLEAVSSRPTTLVVATTLTLTLPSGCDPAIEDPTTQAYFIIRQVFLIQVKPLRSSEQIFPEYYFFLQNVSLPVLTHFIHGNHYRMTLIPISNLEKAIANTIIQNSATSKLS